MSQHADVHPNGANPPAASLQVSDLECVRDDRILFSGLTFTLSPGQTRLVEGPNGSGKTTLLRAICGFVRPDSGTILWCGQDIEQARLEFQEQLAYLGHTPGIKHELTPLENLRVARALGSPRPETGLMEALERVTLAGFEDNPVRSLSAGQRRRVALARLLVTQARLWVLDEPFTALDKAGIRMVESLLEDHCAAGGMALISSHHAVSLACSAADPIRLS